MQTRDKFKIGQKVYAWYHFTKYFKPPQCGIVLFKFPIKRKHHFAYGEDYPDGKCYWWFVYSASGVLVLMPEVCLTDLKEEIESHNRCWSKCPDDTEQIDAWLSLQKHQADRMKYLNA